MTDQTAAKEPRRQSCTVWKVHVTSAFAQSPRGAIPHPPAPLPSFIVPSLFFHSLCRYFLFPLPFLCLSQFPSLSITHSIISPLLCVTPRLSPAQTFRSLSLFPTLPWHNAGIISDLMEVAIFCRGGNNNGNEQYPPLLCPPLRLCFHPSPFFTFFFLYLVDSLPASSPSLLQR